MAVVLRDEFPEIDFSRLIRICIIHDLGEALHGDIPAVLQGGSASKSSDERRDLETILSPLPRHLQTEMLELWDEYESCATAEGRLAKALDKLETVMQHNQGLNPRDFDYEYNLHYGRQHTDRHPLTVALREILDRETRLRAAVIDRDSETGPAAGTDSP